MIGTVFKKVFGSRNERELKKLSRNVRQINELEESFATLDDAALKAKTSEFRERLDKGETLDQLLPEAFAAVREASRRTLGLRHFDVQLIGGMVLHQGRIAEMRTGEGKTLVATLPAYLNALSGNGVHIVTVNDYLASRDANWMRPVYEFLDLSVGIIQSGQPPEEKKAAYNADITYGTNNEFGFDYLRDNMAFTLEDRFMRSQNFAIVDEVDSILIDEARTPLIISGAAQDSSALYKQINSLIPLLKRQELPEGAELKDIPLDQRDGHFVVDEKQRQVEMTEEGHSYIEELLAKEGLLEEGDSLYSAGNLSLLHHVNSGLRAHHLFHKDVEYIVQNGSVVLIDEHTGRTMPGRRLSEGLHQAIEAKEGLSIQAESQTMASTTFQNYFRLYDKLSGMTGTADTEAAEFHQIYGLEVVVIPTNKVIQRQDLNDLIYLSVEEKYEAVVADIRDALDQGAPVLVGTASIDTSEKLSQYLNKAGVKHQILNAKFHEKEAEIIAQAGQPGTVTIATNMAGRGTDIVLGGNLEAELAAIEDISDAEAAERKRAWEARHQQVLDAGGLHIFGTERHESRRIDNQLRGRAGRQGDPGVTRFYLSMEDNLMRLFASDGVRNFMRRLGMERGEAIEHRMVTNAIEKAQKKVEGRNFDIRKQLLEFDNVANDQRRVIYQQRDDLLNSDDISEAIQAIRADVVNDVIDEYVPPQSIEEQWDIAGLESALQTQFAIQLPVQQWLDDDDKLYEEKLRERILNDVTAAYEAKMEPAGDTARKIEKQFMLQELDMQWKDHLATMDHLRQGIGLRGYAARDPKQEYKREAFSLFQSMLDSVKRDVIRVLSHLELRFDQDPDVIEKQRRAEQEREVLTAQHASASALGAAEQAQPSAAEGEAARPQPVRNERKVGRNEPCPCGSGKKYKSCHGALS